jgi:hypothetical protein
MPFSESTTTTSCYLIIVFSYRGKYKYLNNKKKQEA